MLSQTIGGWRKVFWCRKHVRLSMQTQRKAFSTRKILLGNAPENNIAADNKILPAGILLLTKGWLHQSLTCEQYEHFWLIWMHVPTVFFVTAVDCSPQLGRLLKSESRFSSKTMYFLHSCKGKSKSSVCSNCKI